MQVGGVLCWHGSLQEKEKPSGPDGSGKRLYGACWSDFRDGFSGDFSIGFNDAFSSAVSSDFNAAFSGDFSSGFNNAFSSDFSSDFNDAFSNYFTSYFSVCPRVSGMRMKVINVITAPAST
ncbi:hypothetical protein D3C87_1379210 [compost metagenome]